MHTVGGWRHENALQHRDPADRPGVVQLRDRCRQHIECDRGDRGRIDQREPETEPGFVHRFHPRHAYGGGEADRLRRAVHHVRRPQHANTVFGVVDPVVDRVTHHEHADPHPRVPEIEREQAELPYTNSASDATASFDISALTARNA